MNFNLTYAVIHFYKSYGATILRMETITFPIKGAFRFTSQTPNFF